MPCDQCTNRARCESFGVCQIFKHTLPAGSYEQRIKELKPTEVDSMNRLRVQAENKAVLYRRALELACDGDSDKVAFFVSEADAVQDDTDDDGGADAPCKPGTRCSRSIRGLGGCEAGRCEDGDGVRVPDAGQSKCEQRGGCFGGDCCLK